MIHQIILAPDAFDHLKKMTVRENRLILDAINNQLSHRPAIETRNRKPMRRNPLATWELRVGDYGVYYYVETEPIPTVYVKAVGLKVRNRVMISGQEYQL